MDWTRRSARCIMRAMLVPALHLCRRTAMTSPDGAGSRGPAQEPWSYTEFVARYDAIAIERGGWRFEHDRTDEQLRGRYQRSPETYPTLASFAEGLFVWDQRVNL